MPGERILIVDDDRDVVKGLAIRLRAYGYQILCAHDAVSAVSMARRSEPDLILLDLGLPGGDGSKVMQRLESLHTTVSIPIIVISAKDPAAVMKRALYAGTASFLKKPVDNDELLHSIRTALGEAVPA